MLGGLLRLFPQQLKERVADPKLRHWMRQRGFSAFYKDGTVYYASASVMARRDIRDHERAHHRQAELFGRTLYRVLYNIGATLGYDRNPFEVHACKCERR